MGKKITILAIAFAILAFIQPAYAQKAGKMHRIGVLDWNDFAKNPSTPALIQGLRDLGYVEGRNIAILRRSAHGQRRRLSAMAAELVRLKVDVIVGPGSGVRPAIKLTRTIPIVVTVAGDFVARGWARSLREPGGNVTGLSTLALGLMGKQLELLKEAVPSLSKVAIIYVPGLRSHAGQIRQAKEAAPALGLGLVTNPIKDAAGLSAAFRQMKAEGVDGVVVLRSGFLLPLGGRIAALAGEARLPTIFGHAREAVAGGLMAYGADTKALFHGAASYVDKILKGADPAKIPISQATKFNLAVNLKTAKVLGITIPPSVLLRADRVIE